MVFILWYSFYGKFYVKTLRRKQGVKVNGAEKTLLSGVVFNIFINNLFGFISKALLANFADDNTIYTDGTEIELC